MFEKEAEENKPPYACCSFNTGCELWEDGFQKGAEFGYNKANEWHDLRKNPNDLPPKELEEKQLLVRVRKYTEDYILAYYMLDPYYSKNGKRFYSDTDGEYPINIKNVIAWKEIIPPELEER